MAEKNYISNEEMKELHELQRNLHEKIAEKKGVDFGHYSVIDNLRFLFHVEHAELANEVEFFKYWKDNKRNDKEKQLSELADCIHVLLSIIDVRGYQKVLASATELPLWEHIDFLDMFEMLRRNDLNTSQDVAMALTIVLGIGRKLGFAIPMMIEGYKKKNETNLKRQDDEY